MAITTLDGVLAGMQQASYHYGVTVAPAYTSRITVAPATRTRTEG